MAYGSVGEGYEYVESVMPKSPTKVSAENVLQIIVMLCIFIIAIISALKMIQRID